MTGRRVLIVHAALVMRMMMRDMLIGSGFEVVGEAVNGLQAVNRYKTLLPDVVTMDLVMAEMDGIAAVKAIVAEFPQANIIICTSMGQQALVEVIQAGAKALITKPFQPAELIEAIQTLWA